MEPCSFGIEYRLKSLVRHVTSLVFHLSQVHSARAQQELLHRLPLPRLHHPPLLPAQQDSVRHCGRHHRRPAQTGQIVPAWSWACDDRRAPVPSASQSRQRLNVTKLKEAFLSFSFFLFPHWI